MRKTSVSTLLKLLFSFLITTQTYSANNGTTNGTDIQCLQTLRRSISDPNGYLSSWNFSNSTQGFICKFNGIECWNENENRVLNVRLANMGLIGHFPSGLDMCTSLTGLDLSGNNFSGPLPTNISNTVPFITSLDVSFNNFSGQIPTNLSLCIYLNTIYLQHNSFQGQIPGQLAQLDRLSSFDVASNLLSGPIPNFKAQFPADNFANNPGLCGNPLGPCTESNKKSNLGTVIGSAIGGIVVVVLLVGVLIYVLLRRKPKRKRVEDPKGNKWAKVLKGAKETKVSMFENSVSKMKLADLMKATDDFSNDNIILSGRTGFIYKATLQDGSFLSIKRLQDSVYSEPQFKAEMETLGKIKHQNLLLLIGFCVAKQERFLVYQYMPNGTLFDQLDRLDWATRLRIGIGSARGLAWLHHTCNPRIIHRNISSKCILLDQNYEPKISDFGLARLMNPIDTHLSTFVNGEFGEFGYVAPEYARTLVATPKGDVFSFGVVLLELVTKEKPTQVSRAQEGLKGNLVDWIKHLSENNALVEAVDRDLIGNNDFVGEVMQVLKVACACVLPAHKERPTMFEVYQLLRAIGEKYHFSSTGGEDVILTERNGYDDSVQELIVSNS
ncbi:hypothetical protein LUZ60_013411 [Juncus effusus]|nr:hypothetical protein LUZ60_013411 [Juncus effusus]